MPKINKVNTASGSEKASWNAHRQTILLQCCLNEKLRGSSTDSGFQTKGWKAIEKEFNVEAKTNYDHNQLKSKYSSVKKDYLVLDRMINQSGWSFDPVQKIVTHTITSESSWEDYLKGRPEAGKFHNTKVEDFPLMRRLYGGQCATGEFASSGSHPQAPGNLMVLVVNFLVRVDYSSLRKLYFLNIKVNTHEWLFTMLTTQTQRQRPSQVQVPSPTAIAYMRQSCQWTT